MKLSNEKLIWVPFFFITGVSVQRSDQWPGEAGLRRGVSAGQGEEGETQRGGEEETGG